MKIDFLKPSHILFFAGVLPLLGFALSWLFYNFFPNLPFWVETISPVYAYVLLYSLFDNNFWKWRIFRIFNIVIFPDLRGRWKGIQKSSYKEKENENSVETTAYLEIKQTFSKIRIRAYYEKSQSESIVANFAELNDETYLFYNYDNEPNSLKSGTMEMHKGTVKLKYIPRENKLIGLYFNSIGNQGEMKFEFKQKDLLYRFSK